MTGPERVTLEGWGGASRAACWLYRPAAPDEVAAAILDARSRGLSVAARGAGLSYGDAALNEDGGVVQLTRVNRILELDAARGLVRAEAGVTVRRLWQACLPAGWWPAVVPGSMEATVGGCVAMNVHGKNHARVGALGRHVRAVRLVTGEGEERVVPGGRHDGGGGGLALREVLGAQGLTGTVLDATLALTRVHSGFLEVEVEAAASLEETLAGLDRGAREADYTVAWVDCMGPRAGRGVLHHAWHLPPDHGAAGKGMTVAEQRLPPWILGVLPRSQVHRLLRPVTNRWGIRVLNAARYLAGSRRRRYLQSHAAFHFLLDHVPSWKRAYGPGGLMQYQLFIPAETAAAAFSEALAVQRRLGVESFLGVMKRHATEDVDASYSVDGYSLALDFPVPRDGGLAALGDLVRSLDSIVREHDGRIYAAKDVVSRGRLPRRRDPAFSSSLVRRWEGA